MMERFSRFHLLISLYEKPENAFVANFIGENNQLKGKVKSINGKNCVVTTDKGDDITSLENKC